MDNLIKRPLGLAALITATISLLAQPAVEQNAHQAALQNQDETALTQFFQERNLREIPRSQDAQTAPTQELSEEELRTARLVLSIESLFKSTTAN